MVQEPAVRLVRCSFADVPGWREDDHARAFRAFRASCAVVQEQAGHDPSSEKLSRELALVCRAASARHDRRIGRSEARAFFEHFFDPHRVLHDASGGLLTGFYEPVIEGARTPSARFAVPLHRRPADLVNMTAETERARAGVAYTHMRMTDRGLEPYATRADIYAGALTGQRLEIVWIADPVDAFFAQVQGSVRIRLQNGSLIGLTYDGKNGHPYTSIGRVLIDRGEIDSSSMTLDRLGAWLRADKARGRELMQHNASYVFFKETPGTYARGALGTPLVPGRSLAVDTAYHSLGLPVFVEANGLRHWGRRQPFRRLMVAHDVGSAIRGPERGDIYFGSGKVAGARAGITKHYGNFFVLMPRASAIIAASHGPLK